MLRNIVVRSYINYFSFYSFNDYIVVMRSNILLSITAIFILGINPTNAQSINWTSKGIGAGGALYSPVISLHNSQEIWMSCDMSGVYRSTNFGTNWSLQNASALQGSRNTSIQFTSNPQICYTIDHTPLNGNDRSRPVISNDGGANWSSLIDDPTSDNAFTILVDPNTTNRILLSSYTDLYFSSNSGLSFQSIYSFNNNGNGLHVAGAFFDGATIYIGTSAGLIVSINNGNTFFLMNLPGWPTGNGMSSFCGAKQGTQLKLYAVAMAQSNLYGGITGADFSSSIGIYSCVGTTSSWTNISSGITASQKSFFVACASNDINKVYVGGGDTQNGIPTINKSSNGGLNWTSVFNTTQNANIVTGWCGDGGDRGWGYAEYLLGLSVDPINAAHLVFTDLGFAHVSTNGGTTWEQAYVSKNDENVANINTPSFKAYHSVGLENTTCWSLGWGDANHLAAAFSDINGIKSADGGTSWSMLGATTLNSTFFILKHPTNNTIYASTSSVHDIYQTTRLTDATLDPGSGGIRYSNNNGSAWQTLHDFNHPVVWMAIDPTNTNRMYASVIHYANGVGEGGIWKCDNIQVGNSSVWIKINNPPRTEGHPLTIIALNDGSLVASYCARRNSSGSFTASSGIFILPVGTSTWIDRSDAGMFYYTKDLVVDPSDATQNTWYVGVWSGWGGAPNGLGGLYKTTNRGQSWNRIFSAVDRVSSITFNPQATNEVWVSTETDGLWHSATMNTSSPIFVRDNKFPFRQPERIFFNPYVSNEFWVTTFGGGLFRGITNATGIKENINSTVELFPNPSQGSITIRSDETILAYKILDVYGKIILSDETIPTKEISLLVKQEGIYLYELNTKNGKIISGKFSIIK